MYDSDKGSFVRNRPRVSNLPANTVNRQVLRVKLTASRGAESLTFQPDTHLPLVQLATDFRSDVD